MPVRVHIKGFQSIEDAEIVVDRFTAVTGTNNSGKTASIRAVQGVFANSPGDSYVRHGAERLSVSLSFEDGKSVRWEKGPKVKPTYVIEGKTLHPGRTIPDEVAALGVQPIQLGSLSIWPQIAPQFTGQVFLLDLPGSAIAEAVADVDKVGKLTQALRLADSDKRAASSELKVRKKDMEQVRDDLLSFSGLDTVNDLVAGVEAAILAAQGMAADVGVAGGLRDRLQSAQAEIDRLSGVQDVLIPPSEKIAAVRRVGEAHATAVALQGRLEAAGRAARALAGLREVRVPASPTGALEARDELRALRSLRQRLKVAQKADTEARKAAAVLQGIDLEADVTRIAAAVKVQKALEYCRDAQARLRKARADIRTLHSNIESKQKEAAQAVVDVSVLLGDRGSCPVCGTTSSGSHPH